MNLATLSFGDVSVLKTVVSVIFTLPLLCFLKFNQLCSSYVFLVWHICALPVCVFMDRPCAL